MELEQRRSGLLDERNEGIVDVAHLSGETLHPSGQVSDHCVGREGDRVATLTGPHRGGFGDETGLVTILEPGPDWFGCSQHQVAELVEGLDALLTCRTTSH